MPIDLTALFTALFTPPFPATVEDAIAKWAEEWQPIIGGGGGMPPGAVVPAILSAADIATKFGPTGIGLAGDDYEGFAIIDGQGGRPNLDGKFLRFSTVESGGTGGSDDANHSHDMGAHTHSITHTHIVPSHSHSGVGLYANVVPFGGAVEAQRQAGVNFTATHSYTGGAGASSTTFVTSAAVVQGSTATDGSTTTGAASVANTGLPSVDVTSIANIDNRPAYYELVPLMRV